MISALWLWLSEHVFGISNAAAQESLQTLSLFYAMAIVITAYRILRHFRLEGMALYVPLAVVAFHPSFILFSGSINNDALSVVFILGAVLWTLKWYEKQTWEGIVKIALCIGLGMMTKLSAAMVAIPVAAVFLVVLARQLRQRNWRILGQLGGFAVICFPLGLWYPVRNLVRFGVPLTYVQEMPENSVQYLGEQLFLSRILDFSPHQVASVFEQWVQRTGGSYNEYNPLIALLKNAMFGEYINEYTLDCSLWRILTGVVLFRLNVVLAAAALAAMLWLCGKRVQRSVRMPPIQIMVCTAAEAVSGAVLRGADGRILSAFRGGTFYLFHELPLYYADLCHRGSVSGAGIPAAPERKKARVPLALRHRLDVVRLLRGMCGGVLHRAGVGQLGKWENRQGTGSAGFLFHVKQ